MADEELTQKEMSRRGGVSRAQKISPEKRSEIAKKGGEALKAKKMAEDPDYYKRILALANEARKRKRKQKQA